MKANIKIVLELDSGTIAIAREVFLRDHSPERPSVYECMHDCMTAMVGKLTNELNREEGTDQ